MDESNSNETGSPRFADRVYEIVCRIPSGYVTTYGDIARTLGDPRGARQVGWAIAGSPAGLDLPFHRVVNRDGFLSGGWAFGHPEV
ncbi:MAG: MGMT family protein, partial [Thermomicrobiales bacterium]|nr:MGMT family protein [Thermomicrobiales bacterium]